MIEMQRTGHVDDVLREPVWLAARLGKLVDSHMGQQAHGHGSRDASHQTQDRDRERSREPQEPVQGPDRGGRRQDASDEELGEGGSEARS